MTIAACYVSPEGIVLGADSTSTVGLPSGPHFLNYAQMLFEIGEESTLGALTWGLGGLHLSSHRMLLAELADQLKAIPPVDVEDVAKRWSDHYWLAYTTPSPILNLIIQCQQLNHKTAHDKNAAPTPQMRTQEEENLFDNLRLHLRAGFCIAGYILPQRRPAAFELIFDPLGSQPAPVAIPVHSLKFWGAPNMFLRLIRGCDDELRSTVLKSGKWNGSDADFDAIIAQQTLSHPVLPIRGAIDYTHACIASTIKAYKFSHLSQICGGPIELAVITSDRRFRWVRHKRWDIAVEEGDPRDD